MSKVSFVASSNRYYNVERALSLIKSEILFGLKTAKRVVIKPNCAIDNIPLASTNAAALDAVLNFIQPYVKTQIILAEGTGNGDTLTAFKNFGYLNLQEKYDLALVDLNTDDWSEIELLDRHEHTWKARFAKTLLEADYIISVSPPKTHDTVIYSGAIKNVSVGGLVRPTFNRNRFRIPFYLNKDNKAKIHQGPAIMHENIRRLYKHVPLKLAVLDAYEAMQGNGPIYGELVPAHYAIASTNPLAVDWLACTLMDIDMRQIGYLAAISEDNPSDEHFIIGGDWQKHVIQFRLHDNFRMIRR